MNTLFASVPGGTQILVIALLILLLFGGSKLPALARGLGQSIKEFKKGAREDDEQAPKKPEISQVEANRKG
ncbi:MAG: twin-arginine translocase TatA/TatE family subunit [Verrucomicrobiota bacterium]